jgi:hypothetical protein
MSAFARAVLSMNMRYDAATCGARFIVMLALVIPGIAGMCIGVGVRSIPILLFSLCWLLLLFSARMAWLGGRVSR